MELWDFEKYADLPAVLTEVGKKYSYREIDMLWKILAVQINARTLVGLFADNDLGSLVGYLSCIQKDSIPILLPTPKENVSIWQIVRAYQPQYLWMGENEFNILKQGLMQYQEKFFFLDYVLLERKED